MDRPFSAQFVGNLVVCFRELALIEAIVGGSCCYQGNYARLVGAEETYLLSKTVGDYRSVGVYPQMCKSYIFQRKRRLIHL